MSVAFATGNTNPQGIADPPAQVTPSGLGRSGILQNSGAALKNPKSGNFGYTIPVVD